MHCLLFVLTLIVLSYAQNTVYTPDEIAFTFEYDETAFDLSASSQNTLVSFVGDGHSIYYIETFKWSSESTKWLYDYSVDAIIYFQADAVTELYVSDTIISFAKYDYSGFSDFVIYSREGIGYQWVKADPDVSNIDFRTISISIDNSNSVVVFSNEAKYIVGYQVVYGECRNTPIFQTGIQGIVAVTASNGVVYYSKQDGIYIYSTDSTDQQLIAVSNVWTLDSDAGYIIAASPSQVYLVDTTTGELVDQMTQTASTVSIYKGYALVDDVVYDIGPTGFTNGAVRMGSTTSGTVAQILTAHTDIGVTGAALYALEPSTADFTFSSEPPSACSSSQVSVSVTDQYGLPLAGQYVTAGWAGDTPALLGWSHDSLLYAGTLLAPDALEVELVVTVGGYTKAEELAVSASVLSLSTSTVSAVATGNTVRAEVRPVTTCGDVLTGSEVLVTGGAPSSVQEAEESGTGVYYAYFDSPPSPWSMLFTATVDGQLLPDSYSLVAGEAADAFQSFQVFEADSIKFSDTLACGSFFYAIEVTEEEFADNSVEVAVQNCGAGDCVPLVTVPVEYTRSENDVTFQRQDIAQTDPLGGVSFVSVGNSFFNLFVTVIQPLSSALDAAWSSSVVDVTDLFTLAGEGGGVEEAWSSLEGGLLAVSSDSQAVYMLTRDDTGEWQKAVKILLDSSPSDVIRVTLFGGCLFAVDDSVVTVYQDPLNQQTPDQVLSYAHRVTVLPLTRGDPSSGVVIVEEVPESGGDSPQATLHYLLPDASTGQWNEESAFDACCDMDHDVSPFSGGIACVCDDTIVHHKLNGIKWEDTTLLSVNPVSITMDGSGEMLAVLDGQNNIIETLVYLEVYALVLTPQLVMCSTGPTLTLSDQSGQSLTESVAVSYAWDGRLDTKLAELSLDGTGYVLESRTPGARLLQLYGNGVPLYAGTMAVVESLVDLGGAVVSVSTDAAYVYVTATVNDGCGVPWPDLDLSASISLYSGSYAVDMTYSSDLSSYSGSLPLTDTVLLEGPLLAAVSTAAGEPVGSTTGISFPTPVPNNTVIIVIVFAGVALITYGVVVTLVLCRKKRRKHGAYNYTPLIETEK
eukprot:gnl/Dysnectes_brevis/2633_a3182_453.p1 GENE.gnl/Dysnectes_brevis/2633_a3182_453~~gnl/Dysnectes_brevis/2633_a3182_453.p1  ORF type:complete len:1082 (-),score=278.86 gnl/Dysnectes_brevis/2633_a3182_453:829-4074(-)